MAAQHESSELTGQGAREDGAMDDTTAAKIERLRDVAGLHTSDDMIAVALGAEKVLGDRLVWNETQHDSGAWHVTVGLPESQWFGNDGHLLSTDVAECRFLALVSLLSIIGREDDWRVEEPT